MSNINIFQIIKSLVVILAIGVSILFLLEDDVSGTPLGGLASTVCSTFFGDGCAYAGGANCGSLEGNIEGGFNGGFTIEAGGSITINCSTDPTAIWFLD